MISFVTAYLGAARKHFQEKVAELNVIFYDSQFTRSTRRVDSHWFTKSQEIISKVINDVKDVPYVMSTYENPWETFDSYLENRDVAPAEASGVMFYYYLLDCLNACLLNSNHI